MKIADALKGVRRLGVETSPFIYYVENNPVYADKVDAIFQLVELKAIEIMTSSIALTETLVKPLQQGDKALEKIYLDLFRKSGDIRLVHVNDTLAEQAARLRAKYNLKTPDAIHIATAIESECDAFLTNDIGFKRVTEISILLLDALEE